MTDNPGGVPQPDHQGIENDPVLVQQQGSTLLLTLNRPDRLNAVSQSMYDRLLEELSVAEEDSGIRAVVLTGTGRGFCVGADLKAHGEKPPTGADRERYASTAQEVNHRLQTVPVPVVAAVNGHAIGAGLEMALSCDFMIVAEAAKLRFPEVALGTFLGGGVVYTLAERVGVMKARELIYFGEFFSGAEAKALGMASLAIDAEDVLPTAMEWAERLTKVAPLSLAEAKALIGPAGTMSRREALQLEQEALLRMFGTADWQEGVDAFKEKRSPVYRGL